MYLLNKENGYIHGVVYGVSLENSNITEEEYKQIKSILENPPKAPDRFGYRLKDSLEWELYELPVIDESQEVIT